MAGWSLALGAALLMAGCSGGGSSSTSARFAVKNVNVIHGQEWKINRAIDITFNADVDFSTVSLNTINIMDSVGRSATGVFSQPTRADGSIATRVVRFQPTCPTKADNSDAGLQPATAYRLTILGSQTGGSRYAAPRGTAWTKGCWWTSPLPIRRIRWCSSWTP